MLNPFRHGRTLTIHHSLAFRSSTPTLCPSSTKSLFSLFPPSIHPARPYATNSSKARLSPKKPTKRLRNLALATGLGVVVWGLDRTYNAEALARTARAAYHGTIIAADFKLSFDPEDTEAVDALHERVAKRLHYLCVTNGGLWIKFAQALAIQSAILPPPYRVAFANVFDAAPSVDYDEVVGIFRREFGVHPNEAFETFEKDAIASASIAQVHRARLRREDGQPAWKEGEGWVAVKIRKPSIPIQMEWDLASYRALLFMQGWLFDLPMSFVAKEVTKQMRKEVDLHHEAQNAQRTADNIASEPALRDRVMIPQVHWKWTGESVMTADFIDAFKLTDQDALRRHKLSFRATMDAANALIAAQTFKFGFVHCDPHPGNLLVRPHPQNPSRPQLVMIDHGLYIELSPTFRQQYCALWRALFTADITTIENVIGSWGVAKDNADMFASMTLLRPHRLRKNKDDGTPHRELTKAERQLGLKEKLRSMLESQELIPNELIFITRTFRMMQGNNQSLGSPSNRINACAHWAAAGLKHDTVHSPTAPTLSTVGLRTFALERFRLLLFRVVLVAIDIGFALTQARQWVLKTLGSTRDEGFEDLLQRQVTEMAHREFGVDIDESAFSG